jgi:hypothetical protein
MLWSLCIRSGAVTVSLSLSLAWGGVCTTAILFHFISCNCLKNEINVYNDDIRLDFLLQKEMAIQDSDCTRNFPLIPTRWLPWQAARGGGVRRHQVTRRHGRKHPQQIGRRRVGAQVARADVNRHVCATLLYA